MAKNMELPRRQFLAALGAAAGLKLCAQNQEDETVAYLRSLVRTRDWVAGFLNKKPMIAGYHANFGWVYDPDLGCRLVDSYRDDGLDGSRTYHTYERTGARTRVNFPNEQARIRTYGNSYTHCDQVNDGETWQEALAAHLGEPIKNHGVGGYSVYQAYLRMKKVERNHPAAYIILNVFDDDHFRNLDGFRSFRVRDPLEGTNPHVRVRVEKNQVEERPNVCTRPGHVRMLRPQDLLSNRQRAPVKRLDLGVPTLPVVDHSQGVQAACQTRVLLSELFRLFERGSQLFLSLGVLTLVKGCLGGFHVLLPGRVLGHGKGGQRKYSQQQPGSFCSHHLAGPPSRNSRVSQFSPWEDDTPIRKAGRLRCLGDGASDEVRRVPAVGFNYGCKSRSRRRLPQIKRIGPTCRLVFSDADTPPSGCITRLSETDSLPGPLNVAARLFRK